MDLVVGVDIGGTKTKVGLVNGQGECLDQTFFRPRELQNLVEYQNQIKKTIDVLPV